MENFKNEYCSELLRVGFTSEQAIRALSALSVALQGYSLTQKDANIAIYNSQDVTGRLIKLYVDCKRVENCSAQYCGNLELILPKLFEYAGAGPKEITSFDVRGFLANWQIKRNVSGATIDKYRQLINGFFVWMQEEGYISKNPCANIKKVKQQQKEREALSQMELEIIRSNLVSSRERMIIEVLYSTGCRASELANLKLSDINLEGGTVLLFGKGQKQRVGYLNARAIVAVKEYLFTRKEQSEYLLCSTRAPYGRVTYRAIEIYINDINKRVEGKIQHKLHPHLFRHTTATIAMSNGLPVQEVQLLLGHANISTTMIYAKTNKDDLKRDHLKCVI